VSDATAELVLVTGAAGMLGSQVVLDAPAGWRAVGTDLSAGAGVFASGVDVTEEAAVSALLRDLGPVAGVLHCAAYTAVDRAEEEPEIAYRINATACEVLARACATRRIPLVLVGTDFVFDGSSRRPYLESDEPRPLSVYGRTKLAGERLALAAHPDGTAVVRTQWLYGPRGRHFPRTIAALGAERGELRVVQDQVGSPTSTLELAPALWDVLRLEGRGVYHAACEGSCSWHELAAAVLAGCGLDRVRLEPCLSGEFPRPAPRPAYSVLDSSRLAALRGRRLAPWRVALDAYLAIEPLTSPAA
jgi:dTDP-4-dehydrorhamnose reductase